MTGSQTNKVTWIKASVVVTLQVIFVVYLWSKVTGMEDEVILRFKDAIQRKLPEADDYKKELVLDAWSNTYVLVTAVIGIYSLIITTMSIASMFIGSDKISAYMGSSTETVQQKCRATLCK